jgi:hypothetical protein
MTILRKLKKKLLSLGGEHIDTRPNQDIDALLKDGQIFPVQKRKLVRGYPSQCHLNAGLYYSKH